MGKRIVQNKDLFGTKMNASFIKRALSVKHANDFFMAEVKTGPTWFNNRLGILDGWAMRKSWTRPLTTGYEIKVSRSDFLQDKKWIKYLPYCNKFYFVCPNDLINPDELDEGIGLLYCYPSGAFRVVKQAKHRDIELNPDIYIYILMSRLDSDRIPFHSTVKEYFKNWAEDKKSSCTLNFMVKSKITRVLEEAESLLANSRRYFEYNGLITELFRNNAYKTGGYLYELERLLKENTTMASDKKRAILKFIKQLRELLLVSPM